MRACNLVKSILKICGVCIKAVVIGATLPIFVALSSLRGEKAQEKPHILSTYRYVNN